MDQTRRTAADVVPEEPDKRPNPEGEDFWDYESPPEEPDSEKDADEYEFPEKSAEPEPEHGPAVPEKEQEQKQKPQEKPRLEIFNLHRIPREHSKNDSREKPAPEEDAGRGSV